MKQVKKLTYSLKQKLSKIGKNVENYRIKEFVNGEYVLINIKTNEELKVR